MVHLQTGNGLDVCYGSNDELETVFHGLYEHVSGRYIPVRDPQALIDMLKQALEEIENIREMRAK